MAGAAVRIGVLGVGRIGRMHAELLARRVGGAAVTTVFDADPATARAVADELGVRAAGSVEELLTAADGDAGAICTPTPTHAHLIVAAPPARRASFFGKAVSP